MTGVLRVLSTAALAMVVVTMGAACGSDGGVPTRAELAEEFREPDAAGNRLDDEEARCWADATFDVLTAAEIEALAESGETRLDPERRALWGDALKGCVLRFSPGSADASPSATSVPTSRESAP